MKVSSPVRDWTVLYYLNVMAGPGTERQWRICFHPAHVESTGGYR